MGKFTMNPKGTPLPDNHPFKGGMIIFGGRRPVPVQAPVQQETNLDQVAHDQRMAQQTPVQRSATVKGLGALARSKLAETGEPDAEPT